MSIGLDVSYTKRLLEIKSVFLAITGSRKSSGQEVAQAYFNYCNAILEVFDPYQPWALNDYALLSVVDYANQRNIACNPYTDVNNDPSPIERRIVFED